MGIFDVKATHTFTLVSGVEAEVKELTGKHQILLTKQTKGVTHGDKLNKMLADLLVRVGSVTNINEEFVSQMLSVDRRHALVAARQFSMGHEDKFKLNYKYDDLEGEKQVYPIEVDLKEDGTFPIKKMATQSVEYSDIERVVEMKLPVSGATVKFSLLDGKGEAMAANTKKAERSAEILVKMRRPTYLLQAEGKPDVWMSLPYSKVGIKDLGALKDAFVEHEGAIDTEIKFEHPLWAVDGVDDKYVIIDVLNTVDFFFPEGAV